MGLTAVGEFGPRHILAHWQRRGFSRFTGYVRVRHPYTFLHGFRGLFSSHPNQMAFEFFLFHTIVVFQNNTWVFEAGCGLFFTYVDSIVERVCVVCSDELARVFSEGPRHSNYIRTLLFDFCRVIDAAYINNVNWFRDERLAGAASRCHNNCSFGSHAASSAFGDGDRYQV